MKRFSLFLLLFYRQIIYSQDNDIDNENYTVIEGNIRKNLVVLNPSIDDGFCVKNSL